MNRLILSLLSSFLGASQGNDLGPATEDDSEALATAKEEIKYIIYNWIREANRDAIVPL